MRAKLAKRGTRAISSIGRKFKIADDNRSMSLDQAEFAKAMHDFRIGLSKPQISVMFGIFDRDGTGEISYDEFLRTVRGSMNPMRQAVAKKVYKVMDSDGSG
jgi:Ca2+-binding EF-hand superfamily protein